MGVHRDGGYSASVSGFLVVGSRKFRLAKTNNRTFFLAEPCELPAGAAGELLITIDGDRPPEHRVARGSCRGTNGGKVQGVIAPF